MEEIYIDGKKIEPIDEKDAEFIFLQGKFERVDLSFGDVTIEAYIRPEDIEKLKKYYKRNN